MVNRLLKGLSIKRKLFVLTLLTSSVALFFSATVFTVYQLSSFRQELVREFSLLAEVLASQSRQALLHRDRQSLEGVLQTLSARADITAVTVVGVDGKPLAGFTRDGSSGFSAAVYREPGPRFEDRHLVMLRPIEGDGGALGSLYLETRLDGLYHRLTQQSLIGAAVMLASFFVAFLLSARVQRQIAEPIRHLARTATGTLREDAPSTGGAEREDELSVLAGAFDGMLDEIRRRDAALHESERYYRSLIEHASDLITITDEEGRVRYQSPSVERLLGWPQAEVEGRGLCDFVHPKDAVAVRAALTRCLEEPGPVVSIECRFRERGGGWRVLEALMDNQLAEPSVRGVVINSRDITDRKETEIQLRESRERFRRLVDQATDAFFLHDLDGNLVDVNERACRSLGYSRDELLRMQVRDIELNYEDGDVPGAWKRMTPHEVVTIQGVHRRRDGSAFPVEVRVGLFESSGRTLMLALARDMTERERAARELKKAKETAEAATRAKSQFLANMSHEIRTPMTAVIGMTDLLERTRLSPDQEHYVQVIRNSGDALLSVIDDILDISQIESGKVTLDSLDFNLQTVAEGVLDLLAQRAQSKGIELAALVEPGTHHVLRGDAGRLRQVLLNLLGNAVKFTEHGEVELRVRAEDENERRIKLRFEVRDTGIGVPEDLLAQLFAPFVQADSSDRRRHGGTGLGLAICKSLVEMMRGEIGVDSAPEKGATFWFTAWFEKRISRSEQRLAACGELEGLRLLVVDDNETVRDHLARQASACGMRVTQAHCGVTALDALTEAVSDSDPFDVVLVDRHMPGMDGLTLVRTIRADPALCDTRLLLLTALGEAVEPALQRELGLDGQCPKPIKQSQLRRMLLDLAARAESGARSDFGSVGAARALSHPHDGGEPVPVAARKPHAAVEVLLAEDNPVNQEVLVLMLQQFGCRVHAVADGARAVETFEQGNFDTVLMDCQMPGMDGFEATREIRKREGDARRVPIIALTASALAGDRERCLAAGMDAYLTKPVTERKLAELLARWCPIADATSGEGSKGPASQAVQQHVRGGSVLDQEVWAELRKTQAAGRGDFIERLVDLFLADTPQRLARIGAQPETLDLDAVAREAHALRGSCRHVGATRMSEMCSELERRARGAQLEGWGSLVQQLTEEYEGVRAALQDARKVSA